MEPFALILILLSDASRPRHAKGGDAAPALVQLQAAPAQGVFIRGRTKPMLMLSSHRHQDCNTPCLTLLSSHMTERNGKVGSRPLLNQ